ncbi:FtsX-like permease family protein [Alkalicoccus daliensis]|uniref:Bacitracin transport system permease protein n=1 Tax=Alkalicoccus daliensis TaxID=745820 RepID=A0A1H0D0V7_9BACI|nr:FtsX-like permease family protein [Alkalicoccus daliensis]SDN63813.1 bacitracin transport system permease protein [Alkalicoccus daliensis]
MNLNSIILKNFFKNLKNYTLYIFALVFSVVLYFSFVLMSRDDSVAEELTSSDMMSTGFIAGSVLLVVIIVTFVMFANFIFLNRRNRELALFQLIGLTRRKIFRILILENAVIYLGSLIIGIAFGFLLYRTLLMILFRMMQIEISAGMNFSVEAALQTGLLFAFIFALLMAQNYLFLKRTQLINMLTLDKSSESNHKRLGAGTVILGILGLAMIASGYWLSTMIMDFGTLPFLFSILFLTITGTYLTFKFSVAFILNVIRRSKNGHINVKDVLSLTSIMFKMKSNAFLLTLISVISAISMGLMSLSYISYYSVGESVDAFMPHDYVFDEEEDMQFYSELLADNNIKHETVVTPTISYEATGEAIKVDTEASDGLISEFQLNIVSEEHVDGFDVDENEMIITGVSFITESYIEFELNHPVTLVNDDYTRTLELVHVGEDAILPSHVAFGFPQAVVASDVYSTLEEHHNYDEERAQPRESFAIDIAGEDSMEIFEMMEEESNPAFQSKINQYTTQVQGMGMLMFITGFVGFAFLLTSGCILYFKQIGESEDEKGSYQVLRKLGFSENEMIKGLTIKMIVTFGIPLLIGLLHSYFAVNAGWFLFGSEIWTPMLTVMGAYIILYSVFALISLLYYKKVVKESM